MEVGVFIHYLLGVLFRSISFICQKVKLIVNSVGEWFPSRFRGNIDMKLCTRVTPNFFHVTGIFLYPLKTSENQRFSDVCREYRKGLVA